MRTNTITGRFGRPLYSLLLLAFLCLAGSTALAVPKAELHVNPIYTGPGCCWDFELTQKWGAPGNITTVVAQIIKLLVAEHLDRFTTVIVHVLLCDA